MTEKQIHIDGMTCNHCVMAVQKELAKVAHLQVKDVQIGNALLAYDEAKVNATQIKTAIEDAGYTVIS